MKKVYIALENIRSLHNVGAIIRTASFFGIKNIILCGYTGKTISHDGKIVLNERILKTSLGAEKDVSVEFVNNTDSLVSYAEKNDLSIVCIEQEKNSRDLRDWKLKNDTIIVFGNEVKGISQNLMDKAEEIVEIDRKGIHSSLNVATAVGIVLYQITN